MIFSPRAMESFRRWRETMDRARELDPEAFKPFMVPKFSAEQYIRQQAAVERAKREVSADV